jgi:hypothetical protein
MSTQSMQTALGTRASIYRRALERIASADPAELLDYPSVAQRALTDADARAPLTEDGSRPDPRGPKPLDCEPGPAPARAAPSGERMRSPDELPPLDPGRDYGAWCDTEHVLGYTERGDAYVAYAEVWRIEEGETEPPAPPQWKLAGRDGYYFLGMVGWTPLPPTPERPRGTPPESPR